MINAVIRQNGAVMNVTVVLPSLNPDEKLMMVVKGLINEGFSDIVIVNDGSDSELMQPFEEAGQHKEVTILDHEVNKGKGRALKTAFEYCLKNRPNIDGVVTVDGDNQHRPDDIMACCRKMMERPGHVVLGVRDFSGDNVPKKSRYGNNITKFVFKVACGIKISDTQTGLRAIPSSLLKMMTEVSGERFEYETQMLLTLNQEEIPIDEVVISTVYIDENSSTHFNPLKDSIKIYMVIFKFLLSSILSFVIDFGMFTAFVYLIGDKADRGIRILVATCIARIVSSVFNYTFNRKAVFKSDAAIHKSVIKYYILCICQTTVSYVLVFLFATLTNAVNLQESLIKAVVDCILFLISFQIQRHWVFRR